MQPDFCPGFSENDHPRFAFLRVPARLILCVALLLCLNAGAQQKVPDTVQESQKKARAVLDKMIDAMGGQAWLNVQDLKSEVRYGSFYHGTVNATTVLHRFWQWPDKDRLEFNVPYNISVYFWQWPLKDFKDKDFKDKDQGKNATLIFLHNGDKGYERTYRGTKFEDQEQLKRYLLSREYSMSTVLRQWTKDPNVALFYDGPTIAENRSAEKVTIMKGDQAVSLLIASDTHLPIKKVYVVRNPVYHDHDEEVEVYDNWKMVQGINTPYNTLMTHNGEMVSQQYVISIIYNNHLDSSLFDPGPINYDRKK